MPRLKIEEQYHDMYRSLAREGSETTGKRAFALMKDVFMLAFALGARQRLRTPLGASRDIFDEDVLKDRDWDMIRCVALAESPEQITSLGDNAELLRVAQEYANTGIRILQQRVQSSQPEQSVANLVLRSIDAGIPTG